MIRIPVRQLGRSELNTIRAHALGHYQSFLDGTNDGRASGYGQGWMAVMLAAGLHDDARRAGHHRHYKGNMEPVRFISFEHTEEQFEQAWLAARGEK